MGRRRDDNVLLAVYEIAALLPWWIGILLAALAYFGLHTYAQSDPFVAIDPKQALDTLLPNVGRQVARFAQYVVPGLLLTGALISAIRTRRRSRLFASVLQGASAIDLDKLKWREFEDLVHELFRKQGYSVVQTQAGPDGGIDLRIRKGNRLSTVQCKHWRDRKVDVKVVREQLGVMTAAGADSCFVVTSGEYTEAAKQFARRRQITLIDGTLLRMELAPFRPRHREDLSPAQNAEPRCPRCNDRMVRRTAKRGVHAGNEFWGCVRYPECRGIRS